MHTKIFFFVMSYVLSGHASFMPTSITTVHKTISAHETTYESVATPEKAEILSCTKRTHESKNESIACWVKYTTLFGQKAEHRIVSDALCKKYYTALAKQYTQQPAPETAPDQLPTKKPKFTLERVGTFGLRLVPVSQVPHK